MVAAAAAAPQEGGDSRPGCRRRHCRRRYTRPGPASLPGAGLRSGAADMSSRPPTGVLGSGRPGPLSAPRGVCAPCPQASAPSAHPAGGEAKLGLGGEGGVEGGGRGLEPRHLLAASPRLARRPLRRPSRSRAWGRGGGLQSFVLPLRPTLPRSETTSSTLAGARGKKIFLKSTRPC
ncbi:uncharacterized protein LOC126068496 [Elephas maximus indicus]|uniref:uncharacterized protein LOC126068496 n=1 Tax=Elephas maximus indicus TaxID=99487 RepID=UPI0021164363|nr:uncharacterized protein LOC126068496 [Elephas maximus indicus]